MICRQHSGVSIAWMMCLRFIKKPVIAVSTAGVVQALTLAVEVELTASLCRPEDAIKLSRQHLANSSWGMPTLEQLISGRLHAAVVKAMQERGVDCKPQEDQQHLLGSCQTVWI